MPAPTAPTPSSEPICFVGSSTEGINYAKALVHHLQAAKVSTETWNLTTFAIGQTTMEALEEALDRCSFAILVATGDDKALSRSKHRIAPRDNVLFEFGLFVGRLGRDRTFLLKPDDLQALKLPSDLLGVSIGTFSPGASVAKRREGMQSVADEIIERIGQRGPVEGPSDPAVINDLLDGVTRQMGSLSAQAQLGLSATAREDWIRSLLTSALEPFLVRSEDAYSTWLRPNDEDELVIAHSHNLPSGSHEGYRWKRAVGLAGRTWDTGGSAATSKLNQHPWFETRQNCENEAYLCATVGAAGGTGGVLAVGSDNGFSVRHGDLAVLRAYAAMLALLVSPPSTSLVDSAVSQFTRLGGLVRGALPSL